MASLYRLNSLLAVRAMANLNPHTFLALSLSRWLARTADSLRDLGKPFEAGEAEYLAEQFVTYAEHDTSPEGFIAIWLDLNEWGETSVFFENHEKSLCFIPPLPEALEC